jgi:hypothetical protein
LVIRIMGLFVLLHFAMHIALVLEHEMHYFIFGCSLMSSDMEMPRFGEMNPRSFGAKLNYASDTTSMPRFGNMNPRSFSAKLNKVTTLKIQPLAENSTPSFIVCVRLNSTSTSTMHFSHHCVSHH